MPGGVEMAEKIDFADVIVEEAGEIKIEPVIKELGFGKPSKTAWFWIRSGEGFESPKMYLYTPEGEIDAHPYIVTKEMREYLDETGKLQEGKFYFYQLYGSKAHRLDFVNMKLDKYGKMNSHNASRLGIYENEAVKQWVRMRSHKDDKFYSIAIREQKAEDPVWPTKPVNILEAIQLCFGDFVIKSKDHPEIKKLRGIL